MTDELLKSWKWPAGCTLEQAQGGLINQTWWVLQGSARVAVVQQLNTAIFSPEVHYDIEAVTQHLRTAGLLAPELLPTRGGALWLERDGLVFRAMTVVGSRTVHTAEHEAEAYSAAELVGRTHRALRDFQWEYRSVRPGAHDTDKHAATLRAAVSDHPHHRLIDEVAPLAEGLLTQWESMRSGRQLPERHIHGDLKISNVRFDGSEAVALIDLDTWQRGTLDMELGDAMRSWCNTATEDDPRPAFSLRTFRAAMAGYASGAGDLITEEEWASLSDAPAVVAIELAMRFAADALQESYFGWDRRFGTAGAHNLLRARGQFALAESALASRESMAQAIRTARMEAT